MEQLDLFRLLTTNHTNDTNLWDEYSHIFKTHCSLIIPNVFKKKSNQKFVMVRVVRGKNKHLFATGYKQKREAQYQGIY